MKIRGLGRRCQRCWSARLPLLSMFIFLYHFSCFLRFSDWAWEACRQSKFRKCPCQGMCYIWNEDPKLALLGKYCILGTRAKCLHLWNSRECKSFQAWNFWNWHISHKRLDLPLFSTWIAWYRCWFHFCSGHSFLLSLDWDNFHLTGFQVTTSPLSDYCFLQTVRSCWLLATINQSECISNQAFAISFWFQPPKDYLKS